MATSTEYPEVEADVKIVHLGNNLVDSYTKIRCTCSFCGKKSTLTYNQRGQNNTITGKYGFHCGFCIKHNLYNKLNKDTLILSFRGIIGFYYYCLYKINVPTIYLNEIIAYIDLHQRIGNNNPVFLYDPESFCWFIDFSKIGDGKYNIKVKEVLNTILEVLSSFNMYKYYPEIYGYELFKRYEEAIMDFYKSRNRPVGKKILVPTLAKCNVDIKTSDAKITFEDTRNFTPNMLISSEIFK